MERKAKLKLIVCQGENGLIGDLTPKGNGLLWHSKEELNYYKNQTIGNIVLYGKKTAEVVPIELMKKTRDVIILSRDTDINKLLMDNKDTGKSIFICGGLMVYKYFLENYLIDEVLISKLKPHVKIEKAETPLYFPDVTSYGYKKFQQEEYGDFIVEKYRKEI